MLITLSIRDVVLIGRLDLSLETGLSVLTGETGAGKSILLDALGLALGVRADARLVRYGAKQASVTAVFEISAENQVFKTLEDRDIDIPDRNLVLRRVLHADGRSKAFINDQPIGIQLLKEIGQKLVEVHGQFDNQRLLNENTHLSLLDAYGDLSEELKKIKKAYALWSAATEQRKTTQMKMEEARKDQEFNLHALEELESLDPKLGEEALLASQRKNLMNSEKLVMAMNDAAAYLEGDSGAVVKLQKASNSLDPFNDKSNNSITEIIATLKRAQSEAAEAEALLENFAANLQLDPKVLEKAEERLFSLRALSRKHNLDVEELVHFSKELRSKVQSIEDGEELLSELTKTEEAAQMDYQKVAEVLSSARKLKAIEFDQEVAKELKSLKMEKALFSTTVEALNENNWGASGQDKVTFKVSTNPGAPSGPLNKISSGGELARFTLALKAILARADPILTLIFDEVESGVGGAVADAVGERLEKLACEGLGQVLVVTHSPQVAARGMHHWLVTKTNKDSSVLTTIQLLNAKERKEEIARMLAGSKVTNEARAAADSLIESANS
jgi:DNA repair protein RecN (Recombination protein N)